MRREKGIAAVLAAACGLLAVWGPNGADLIYGLTLPLVWLGAALRALSLSGIAGNALAVLLYAALSLSPLALLWQKVRRRERGAALWLPAAVSGYLFFLLFYLANPSMIRTLFHPIGGGSSQALPVEQAILCMFLYALMIAWWVLALLRDDGRLTRKLRLLVRVAGALMIVSVCYINAAQLKSTLAALPWPGEDPLSSGLLIIVPGVPASNPAWDALMAWLRFAFDSAPTLVLLTVLPMTEKLLDGLEQSFFSQENQLRAAAVASRCKTVILVSLGGLLALNGLQLLFARNLANVNVSGQLPLDTLLLSLAMLLLSKYLAKSCEVYRENQMMI